VTKLLSVLSSSPRVGNVLLLVFSILVDVDFNLTVFFLRLFSL